MEEEKCSNCGSINCHKYADVIVCFDCGFKKGKLIKKVQPDFVAQFNAKMIKGGD